MDFLHEPVLLYECMELLNIKPDGIYIDCTAGGGGHSSQICRRLSAGGRLIAIDQDADALAAAAQALRDYPNAILTANNFSNIKDIFAELRLTTADGFLLDLGVSSYQLDAGERGFSYMHDARLDMRMNRENALTAYDVVNGYSKEDLRRIISDYGEERWAARIAEFIVQSRETPISTTLELAGVIKNAVPRAARSDGPHPAKRTFQAIRIEVNNELGILADAVTDMVELLNSGGRICVITFHSLEDRIIKNVFRHLADPCTCPRELPVCVCGKEPLIKQVTRKPLQPDAAELSRNRRARSAKLRAAEKI